jgi:heme exporter protein D
MTEFLAMGGYARFVWPAYGVAVLVLVGMAAMSFRAWRRQRRIWAALETTRPQRRSPSP